MLSFILGLLPSAFNTINSITAAIANERLAAISAKTESERNAAQERVATLQAQRDVLVTQSSHSNIPVYVGMLFAVGPILYLNKIFICDKVLRLCGDTDPLDPNLWTVVSVILGGYFLYSGLKVFK